MMPMTNVELLKHQGGEELRLGPEPIVTDNINNIVDVVPDFCQARAGGMHALILCTDLDSLGYNDSIKELKNKIRENNQCEEKEYDGGNTGITYYYKRIHGIYAPNIEFASFGEAMHATFDYVKKCYPNGFPQTGFLFDQIREDETQNCSCNVDFGQPENKLAEQNESQPDGSSTKQTDCPSESPEEGSVVCAMGIDSSGREGTARMDREEKQPEEDPETVKPLEPSKIWTEQIARYLKRLADKTFTSKGCFFVILILKRECFEVFKNMNCFFPPFIEYVLKGISDKEYFDIRNVQEEEIARKKYEDTRKFNQVPKTPSDKAADNAERAIEEDCPDYDIINARVDAMTNEPIVITKQNEAMNMPIFNGDISHGEQVECSAETIPQTTTILEPRETAISPADSQHRIIERTKNMKKGIREELYGRQY